MSKTDNACGPYCPLNALYGPEQAKKTFQWLQEQIQSLPPGRTAPAADFSPAWALLSMTAAAAHALSAEQLTALSRSFSLLHIRGDLSTVTPQWVENLPAGLAVMLDLPLNDVPVRHPWFQAFLQADPKYSTYFIPYEPDADLLRVRRPTADPIVTRFETVSGPRRVWTTFGPQRADLNYQTPAVIEEMIERLLQAALRGAAVLRLPDAPYLWKESGTPCLHLAQSHGIVHMFRDILADAGFSTRLACEVRGSFAEVQSYFGDGVEASLIYNAGLPALLLEALTSGQVEALRHWTRSMSLPSFDVTYLNLCDFPDGIPLEPAAGLSDPAVMESLIDRLRTRGLALLQRPTRDAYQEVYHVQAGLWQTLEGSDAARLLRWIAAQNVVFSLVGAPALNAESLWEDGQPRTESKSLRWEAVQRLLAARSQSGAFHPAAAQMVLDTGPAIFGLLRLSPDGREVALCLQNFSAHVQPVDLDAGLLGPQPNGWYDLLSGKPLAVEDLWLDPLQGVWLTPAK